MNREERLAGQVAVSPESAAGSAGRCRRWPDGRASVAVRQERGKFERRPPTCARLHPAIGLRTDVTRGERLPGWSARHSAFGPVDILVNNAGLEFLALSRSNRDGLECHHGHEFEFSLLVSSAVATRMIRRKPGTSQYRLMAGTNAFC